MPDMTQDSLRELAIRAVEKARKAGADAADVVVMDGRSASVSVREGETEAITSSESCDLGLRVLCGSSQAIVSTSKFDDAELDTVCERAVAMARLAPGDPFVGLADAEQLASDLPDLELADGAELTTEQLHGMALEAEAAGRGVKGVAASAGAGANMARRRIALAASNGFSGAYERTFYDVSAAMIAGSGTSMARDYDYQVTLYLDDLPAPEEIGRLAGERTARRANPRKVKSQTVPVVFEQRLASSLLGHLSGAINGSAIVRGTSFLKDRLGEPVFSKDVTIVDDGRMARGLGSRPFDAEGLATRRRDVVAEGVLKSWLLDLRTARQLDLAPTGNAARSTASAPSPSASNFNMQPGELTPEDLTGQIKAGFLVTELIGMGVNGVTGDYSRGAAGFWIEDGQIAYPVSEITIAGNLADMFRQLTPANDLVLRGATNAPTCRIEEMTIAGI